ncbi:MAG: hypothetical protein IJW26_06050 [Clostridia bacterium]|nr:hypothetical protein [Clostridia bacterium]
MFIERYRIYETYHGRFDSQNFLCSTDTLFNAVHVVELLKKTEEEYPCYSYDFQKVVSFVDSFLDYYPGGSLSDIGHVYTAVNYAEFLKQRENFNKKGK